MLQYHIKLFLYIYFCACSFDVSFIILSFSLLFVDTITLLAGSVTRFFHFFFRFSLQLFVLLLFLAHWCLHFLYSEINGNIQLFRTLKGFRMHQPFSFNINIIHLIFCFINFFPFHFLFSVLFSLFLAIFKLRFVSKLILQDLNLISSFCLSKLTEFQNISYQFYPFDKRHY